MPSDRRVAGLPPIYISSMFFPGKPPGMLGGNADASSGAGWQIVFYWVLSTATVKSLSGPEDDWPPHLKLWKRYVRDADRDLPFNGAMKGVAQADNMKDLPLPRFIKGYNGKPVSPFVLTCRDRISKSPASATGFDGQASSDRRARRRGEACAHERLCPHIHELRGARARASHSATGGGGNRRSHPVSVAQSDFSSASNQMIFALKVRLTCIRFHRLRRSLTCVCVCWPLTRYRRK